LKENTIYLLASLPASLLSYALSAAHPPGAVMTLLEAR